MAKEMNDPDRSGGGKELAMPAPAEPISTAPDVPGGVTEPKRFALVG